MVGFWCSSRSSDLPPPAGAVAQPVVSLRFVWRVGLGIALNRSSWLCKGFSGEFASSPVSEMKFLLPSDATVAPVRWA